MRILGLDHLAIAVKDLAQALSFYRDILGFQVEGMEEVPSEGMKAAMVEKGGVTLELMEPTDPHGAISRFIAKRGGGLHHLTFRVEDIEEAVRECRQKGLALIEPAPRPGARGQRVAFLHPRSTGGVLIELSQPAPSPLVREGRGKGELS